MRARWMAGLIALLMLPLCAAGAQEGVRWVEGEMTYPEGDDWVYRYAYRYPVLAGDSLAVNAVNGWFEVAFREMDDMILPMFAGEKDMASAGRSEIVQEYEITCHTERFFSFRQTQTHRMGDMTVVAVSGQVFAMSGEYMGETLTLRGLLGVGDSSEQIAGCVLADVFERLQQREDAGRWPDMDTLYEEFDPETQFYADEQGNAVFFLQPGAQDDASGLITFTYSAAQAEALLKAAGDQMEGL